jgi:ATP-dependent protease ClpP protease subunit
MLIHPGFSAVDGPVLDVISRTEWEKTVLTQMYDIYYDRAVKINKNLKLNQLRKYFSMDRYLASEDALKFGLVDSII